jgi:DNA-binding NtrC family response regulator
MLKAYDWPGNVRELENEVQRAVIQAESETIITPELLSSRLHQAQGARESATSADDSEKAPENPSGTLREIIDRYEKRILVQALAAHGNNKTSAAKTLGITREGLHKKLKGFGL